MTEERERDDAKNVLDSSIFYDKNGKVVRVGDLVGKNTNPVITIRNPQPEEKQND